MSENKMMHTPGPWKVFGDIHAILPNGPKEIPYRGIERVGRTEGENIVALLIPNDADACLIAAAPELLEAAREALRLSTTGDGIITQCVDDLLRAAITKAGAL